jgi:hypothetical protein
LKTVRFVKQFLHSMALTLVLIGICAGGTLGQDGHPHAAAAQSQQLTPAQSALLKTVRESTERFKHVLVAEAAGYALQFGCVSGPDAGAMGLHFVNFDLVQSGAKEIDVTRPQILLYEPMPDGRLQLVGADYLVLAADWDKNHPGQAPQLMGQLFHYFESPNRFGLPAFYTLHVWAWKENPNGAFVNWHPNVSCQQFSGQ